MSSTLDAFLLLAVSDPWLMVMLGLYRRHLLAWLEVAQSSRSLAVASGAAGGVFGRAGRSFLALASPIQPFSWLLLQVHMVQHLLLMMVRRAGLACARPLFPLVRGLPEPVRTYWVAPCCGRAGRGGGFTRLTHPLVAWPLYVAVTWLWHTPWGYELAALASNAWHVIEHGCFIAAGRCSGIRSCGRIPSRPRWSPWLLFPYLVLADVQNTVLAAWLTFSNHVLYSHYEQVPRIGGISALDDQATAGVLMWVPGSIAFLLPLFWIGVGMLYGLYATRTAADVPRRRTGTLPPIIDPPRHAVVLPRFDLLRTPGVGTFLRWRFSRQAIQVVMVAMAAAVIADGLRGPQVSPMNLAGVLPWIHWRGMLIFGLFIAGNVSCMACPFTLPRTIARRWMPAGRLRWPRWRCAASGRPALETHCFEHEYQARLL